MKFTNKVFYDILIYLIHQMSYGQPLTLFLLVNLYKLQQKRTMKDKQIVSKVGDCS